MTELAHSLRGYKQRGCRCSDCCDAYERYKARERLKNLRTPIKHHLIDATPLLKLYEKISVRSGTMHRNLKKWEKYGISIYDADTYCMKLGFHPIEIFGAAYFEGLADEEEQYKYFYGESADV